MIPQTAIQKVVALQDLADDLHVEIRTLRQRAERADDLLTEIRTLRQRAERAEAAIARVRALHFVEPDDPQWCYECNVVMPCPTLRALDGDA